MDHSKRDIYDLIAELAKSANIDIHGTEFDPNIDIQKRKTINDRPANSLPRNVAMEHQGRELVSDKDALSHSRIKWLEELIRSNSIEELQALQNELKLANETSQILKASSKESIENEPKSSSIKFPSRIGILPKQKNASIKQQASSFEEFFEMQEQSNRSSAINKLNGSNDTASTSKTNAQLQNHEGHANQGLHEINRDLQLELQANHQSIHDELKQINQKIDRLDSNQETAQILSEVKKGSDKVFDQVVKTREFIMQDFARMEEAKSIVAQSYLKWLGIFNLFLMVLIIFYLLFQKFSALSQVANAKQSYSTMPSMIENSQDNNANQISNNPIRKEASTPYKSSVSTPSHKISNGSGNKQRQAIPVQRSRNLAPLNNIVPSKIQVRSSSSNHQGKASLAAATFNSSEKKEPSAPVSRPIADKLNSSKEEVIFGED